MLVSHFCNIRLENLYHFSELLAATYISHLDGVKFVLNSLVYDLGQRDWNSINESQRPGY